MPEAEVRTIRRAQSGDPEAFRELIALYQQPVMAILYRFLGGRFAQEMEDFAQDVFIKVFKSIDRFRFDRQTKFSTWLYTFVKNYSIDVLKKKRLATVSLQPRRETDKRAPELPGKTLAPLQALGEDELARTIEQAIGSLPDDQREAFVLREYEDLGYAEIAEILGCSEGTVKSRIYRARETLRIKLQPYLRDGSKGKD